jgi:hypothetical protein
LKTIKALSFSSKICPSFERKKMNNVAPGRGFAEAYPTAVQKGASGREAGVVANPVGSNSLGNCDNDATNRRKGDGSP